MASYPKIGQTFDGRFELLAELGSGGMGSVFKANQLDARRVVAIKIMHAGLGERDDFADRFLREAKALSVLQHENIVTVYHMGLSTDNFLYIAMELANGSTLRNAIDTQGKFSLARAIKITKQCCSALQYMHEAGIVHRDLKPENIILQNDPEADFVKLIDFGLAKVNTGQGDQKLTATGEIVGSINYMSPEQCSGRPSDQRGDIYALAACFYEMLSGVAPFAAESPIAVMYKHMHGEVPQLSTQKVKGFHPLINHIIAKGLAKDPDKRYSNVADMSADLDRLSLALENPVQVSAFRPQIVAGTIVLTLILSAAFVWSKFQRAPVSPPEVSLPKPVRKVHRGSEKVREFTLLVATVKLLESEGKFQQCLKNIQRACEIGKSLAPESVNLTLAELNLGDVYLSLGEYQKCIDALNDLASIKIKTDSNNARTCRRYEFVLADDSTYERGQGVSAQDVFDARAMTADAYLHLGKKEKARELLKELVAWPWGLDYGGPRTLSLLLGLGDIASAKTLISHTTNTRRLVDYSAICRKFKNVELCKMCLRELEPVIKIIGDGKQGEDLLGPDGQYLVDIKLEHAMLPIAEGHLELSQKKLREFLATSPLVQEDAAHFGTDDFEDLMTLISRLREASMPKEALDLARKKKLGVKNELHLKEAAQTRSRIVLADLLVLNNLDDEARAVLHPTDVIVDTVHAVAYPARARVDEVASGKIDRKNGLLVNQK